MRILTFLVILNTVILLVILVVLLLSYNGLPITAPVPSAISSVAPTPTSAVSSVGGLPPRPASSPERPTPAVPPSPQTLTPVRAPTPTPVPAQAPGAPRPIDFQLRIAKIEETGLTSRRLTTELTNTGDADAHNVSVKLEVFSRGQRIAVNGKDAETVSADVVPARQTLSRAMDISFSLADGFTIQRQGAEFVVTITSTEKTSVMRFTYP